MAFGKSQSGTAAEQAECSFMGKDVTFEGTLTVEGNVQIDGRIKGELRTTGTLTIGEHAIINGNVLAGTLIMSGKIEGTVIASEKIKILKPGILIGDIRTRAISIEAGAHFQGQSDWGTRRGPRARVERMGTFSAPFPAGASARKTTSPFPP